MFPGIGNGNHRFFQALENLAESRHGGAKPWKFRLIFSAAWNFARGMFQGLEKSCREFPSLGNGKVQA
jgi:hypothetical protein